MYRSKEQQHIYKNRKWNHCPQSKKSEANSGEITSYTSSPLVCYVRKRDQIPFQSQAKLKEEHKYIMKMISFKKRRAESKQGAYLLTTRATDIITVYTLFII